MRIIRVIVVAALLVVFGATTAGADIPESDGNAYGCYLRHAHAPLPKGNLRVVDLDAGGHCSAREGSFHWMAQATLLSDRASKQAFASVDDGAVLSKLAKLPITSWQYKTDDVRHIGPMAQDFNKAFGVGPDPKHIAIVDGIGVNLAATKALDGELRAQQREILALGFLIVLILAAFGVYVRRTRRSAG